MKLSVMIGFVLIISGVFYIFGLMVNEANLDNPNANADISDWQNRYNYVNDVNSTLSPLIEKIKKVSDPEQGWFVRITSGIAAVPYFILLIPQAIFSAFIYMTAIIVDFLGVFAIPVFIITIAIMLLLIYIIFKIVEFFQRQQI